MTTTELIATYARVWSAFNQTESHHQRFHRSIWGREGESGPPESQVVTKLLNMVDKSPASEEDRCAIARHIGEDWEQARILATLASSCHCRGRPDGIATDFATQLRTLRERANLSAAAVADAADISRESIRLYENGERRPTWDAVQAIAKALGVTTDTFRGS